MQNEKKLVVLFPGFGYGPDKPLLYYAAKVARRQGLDCMVVQYSQLFPHEETPQASAAKSYPGAAQDAMTQIPAGYDRYICIAKSFGTMVAAGWVKGPPGIPCDPAAINAPCVGVCPALRRDARLARHRHCGPVGRCRAAPCFRG